MIPSDELDCRFSYHPPKNFQPDNYKRIREAGRDAAGIINSHCPDSREKSIAFRKLEEAVMWANAAIARRS